VGIDEVAVLHSRAILDGNDHAIAIQADLRNPPAILDNPELRDLLDLSQPTALLLVAILHCLTVTSPPPSWASCAARSRPAAM
jgi:S-adenosyl methyltransferase